MEKRDWKIVGYLVIIGVAFLFAGIYLLGSLLLLYPIVIFYVFHRAGIWQTKKRAKLGTIAILIVSLISIAFYPIINNSFNTFYDQYHVYPQGQSVVSNVKFNAFPEKYYNVTIYTTKNITSQLVILKENNTTGNYYSFLSMNSTSKYLNGTYITTFTVNVQNFTKGIYETNITMENKSVYIIILAPRIMTQNEYYSTISNMAIIYTLANITTMTFISSEGFFLAIIFGAHVMRKGRQTIAKQQ
ncbi:MAG: hypothetical protein ACP5G5_00950 [Thermoplasmata archaeon]|jgi:hypothetical protein